MSDGMPGPSVHPMYGKGTREPSRTDRVPSTPRTWKPGEWETLAISTSLSMRADEAEL